MALLAARSGLPRSAVCAPSARTVRARASRSVHASTLTPEATAALGSLDLMASLEIDSMDAMGVVARDGVDGDIVVDEPADGHFVLKFRAEQEPSSAHKGFSTTVDFAGVQVHVRTSGASHSGAFSISWFNKAGEACTVEEWRDAWAQELAASKGYEAANESAYRRCGGIRASCVAYALGIKVDVQSWGRFHTSAVTIQFP
ncbi:unnamed protein product [Pedinophyceae sp. YPF-701]|nr:unnamed protein product [Pedinophyceae sp. YPF-701]